MKVNYTSADGRLAVEFDVKGQTELFEALASFQEIFEDNSVVIEGESVPAKDIAYSVRQVVGLDEKKKPKTFTYYEKKYVGANPKLFGYKLPFGQKQDDSSVLFPKRKQEDGSWKNNGWRKYEAPPQGSAPV